MTRRTRRTITTGLDILGAVLVIAGVALTAGWLAVAAAGILVLAGSYSLAGSR